MEFNMENGTFTSNEDVPYAVVLDLVPSDLHPPTPESWDGAAYRCYTLLLLIQGQGSQTIVWIGMMAILMIAFLGAKCFCKNEEQVVEEPVEEEVHPRGLFSQVIDKTMSFFGH